MDYDALLDRDKIAVPAWMDDRDWTVGAIRDLNYGGCASGVYMPACVYHEALATMMEHGDDVLEYVENTFGEVPAPPAGCSWAGLACHYLSMAVELWASSVEAMIEGGEDVLPDDESEVA